MRQRFVAVAEELLDQDEHVALVLADISESAFKGAIARHPARALNLGIREQALIGVTAGLALASMRPIAHTYAPFLIERPFEQIKLDLNHQDVGAVLVSIGGSYEASREGRTHHAPGDVALLDTLADWTVHVPGHADEMEPLLRQAIAGEGRVYLRLTERGNAAAHAAPGGRVRVMKRGRLGAVLAVGPMLDRTLAAVSSLDVTVLYAATVRPFDAATLRAELVADTIVIVEPYLQGTSAHRVNEALAGIAHRALFIGARIGEVRRYGDPEEQDVAQALDAASLRERIDAFLSPVTARR